MLPSRTPTPMSGTQGGEMPTQSAFPSLVSPREQFNNTNMLGNTPNVSSLFNHSFSNGIPNNGGAEPDPMSNMGNSMSFSSTPSSMVQPNMSNQQPNNHHHQQQYQSLRGLNGVGHVKLEQQMAMGPIKLEAQQNQNNGTLPPIKLELQNSDQSLFLQQQQILNMSRQSPQAQINYLHQQRLMQLQKQQQLQQQQQQQQNQHQQQQQNQHQHQQQFALKSVPLQRSLSQLQQQNLASRSNVRPVYEPGMCARRLSRYMYEQRNRPEDNNIEFWKKFVSEFFAPNAKKKWCVSLYGDGRQTTGVFPQDVWQCEICNRKPGRGFEATAEVLPRLFKIKYESGTLEELLYVDMPQEYHNNSGQIVLDYAKAIQETVLDQLRVVRDGQLRLVFTPELKICSWEFCARRHEELIPRRLLIPQVSQLGAVAQQYQTATQNASSSMSVPELQDNCNMFVASARQLAKALEVPLVNDLGYTKRYVRCLQISEVVNSMKDLIDYSGETGMGPMESLAKFPRRTSSTPTNQSQIKEEPNLQQQQTVGQNSSNNDHNSSVQANTRQRASINGIASVNNSNLSTTSSSSNIVGIPHQSPMNNNPNGSYIGNGVHVPSPNSSSTISQPNLSPFVKSTPSTSNNNTIQDSHPQHDVNNSQTSVQKILQEMIMSPQMNDVKNVNRTLSTSNISGLNGGNVLMRNGFARSGMLNGIRDAMGNNSMSMNGRVGINAMVREQNSNQQQGLGDQFLNGLGFANGFNNLQVDWKPSR